MASNHPHNPPSSHSSAAEIPGQAQMRRNDLVNQPSDGQSQEESTFLQETGTQVRNMAAGAANIAKGAAAGAANLAQGAADAVKNTLGMNSADSHPDSNSPNSPSHRAASNNPGSNPSSNPSNNPRV